MEGKFKGTPGPWRWELNLKSKKLQLCGHGECGPYDFTVMDFKRWGMDGAVPRFREGEMNTMVKAYLLGEIVPERHHHSDWFQNINHQDAQLIALSPELLTSILRLIEAAKPHCVPTSQLNMRVEESEFLIKNLLSK